MQEATADILGLDGEDGKDKYFYSGSNQISAVFANNVTSDSGTDSSVDEYYLLSGWDHGEGLQLTDADNSFSVYAIDATYAVVDHTTKFGGSLAHSLYVDLDGNVNHTDGWWAYPSSFVEFYLGTARA